MSNATAAGWLYTPVSPVVQALPVKRLAALCTRLASRQDMQILELVSAVSCLKLRHCCHGCAVAALHCSWRSVADKLQSLHGCSQGHRSPDKESAAAFLAASRYRMYSESTACAAALPVPACYTPQHPLFLLCLAFFRPCQLLSDRQSRGQPYAVYLQVLCSSSLRSRQLHVKCSMWNRSQRTGRYHIILCPGSSSGDGHKQHDCEL